MAGTVFLIRHASSVGQEANAPLSEQGRLQAKQLVATLESLAIDAVFTSPYRRAMDTARPFAHAAGLTATIIEGLHERVLSPEPLADWMDHVRISFEDTSYSVPGGESLSAVATRGLDSLARIAQDPARRPAVVTHGNLIAAVLHQIDPRFGFEDWRNMTNPDLFEVQMHDGVATGFSRAR